jgi:predicted RNA-binding protein with PUA-like domain
MKSEPSVYSIDDLKKDKSTSWDCIRNYQARNFMQKDMNLGDLVLFYHSNADPAGVAGIAKVCKTAYPDDTCWDKKSKYYDPKSTVQMPRWFMVDVQYVQTFKNFIDLSQIKSNPTLKDMLVIKQGMRLSIQPVSFSDFTHIQKLGTA